MMMLMMMMKMMLIYFAACSAVWWWKEGAKPPTPLCRIARWNKPLDLIIVLACHYNDECDDCFDHCFGDYFDYHYLMTNSALQNSPVE